jgi:hypothetical protein
VLLNLPLIIAGLLGGLVDYKLEKITRNKYLFQTCLWLIILIGLMLAQPIYRFLYTHHMTQTASMSLFDVIELTGIVYVLFMANRSRVKSDVLERRIQDLHQELSIRLSESKKG